MESEKKAAHTTPKLKAPFPFFGKKSQIADLVWERFGDVKHYIEPFAGSLTVLLARPTRPKLETVNDKDALISNFWRAVKNDPEGVAKYADWPINEVDLEARHKWLVSQKDFVEKMKDDPDYYDVKIAGWWVWGVFWIGMGWCEALYAGKNIGWQKPYLTGYEGIHRTGIPNFYKYLKTLAKRLRRVRVFCGDWSWMVVPIPIILRYYKTTGVFLNPPSFANRDPGVYSVDYQTLSKRVEEWCLENGNNPYLRIALCGYESEYKMPDTWEEIALTAGGEYGNQRKNGCNDNMFKERIWFSPHCLKPFLSLLEERRKENERRFN